MIFVRTGPAAGNISVMVSDWNLTTASVIMGWNTPDAPDQGSVRSSYWSPSSFKPSVYAFSQSLRELLSLSMSPDRSPASDCSAPSSISSAKLLLKSSVPSPGSIEMSKPSMWILTASGSTISISIALSSCASSSIPLGAWYKPLSIFVAIFVLSSKRFDTAGRF